MNTTIFTEAIDLSEAVLDAPNRTLKGVVLIRAGESVNKRDYPAAVLQASAPVFEGVKAYANHPGKNELRERSERSIRDITGWYENVRYVENRLVADRHFTPTQAGMDAWALAEMVATGKAPKSLAGLSINAVGKARARDDGGVVIEAITFAHSVDDVTQPAAGGSYIESADGDLFEAVLREMTFEEWYQARPDFTERVKKEMKTVRQDKALADAQALAERVQGELQAAQQQLADVQAQRVADVDTMEALRRDLKLEQVMSKINLPEDWEAALREQLSNRPLADWTGIIEREKQKAKSAGHRATMTGAGQQVNTPLPATIKPVNPVEAMRQRLAEAKSPEELRSIMHQLGLQE